MSQFLQKIIITIVVIFAANNLSGQSAYMFGQEWSISGHIGTTKFYGDVSDKTNSIFSNSPFSKFFYQDRRFGAGIYLDKKITPYIGVRGTLLYADLKSTKESEKIYFEGDTYEYSISAIIDLTNVFLGIDKYRNWSIYGFIGLGFTETSSQLYDLNTGENLLSSGESDTIFSGSHKGRTTETTMPIGIGYNFKFKRKVKFFIEVSRHIVHTNKLDAYPVEGTNFESFGLLSIGATYNFSLPSHWGFGGNQRYTGKSTDPAIKAFNKRKRVVMKTKANKRAMKKRKKYGRKRNKRNRW